MLHCSGQCIKDLLTGITDFATSKNRTGNSHLLLTIVSGSVEISFNRSNKLLYGFIEMSSSLIVNNNFINILQREPTESQVNNAESNLVKWVLTSVMKNKLFAISGC